MMSQTKEQMQEAVIGFMIEEFDKMIAIPAVMGEEFMKEQEEIIVNTVKRMGSRELEKAYNKLVDIMLPF